MINLYQYHKKPKMLDQYENRLTIVPELAYYHAKKTKQRFPAGETAIMKNPRSAYGYAINIINDRWQEAEPSIMKSPINAHWYARDIIKGRWPEAEPYIMKDPYEWNNYKSQFGIQ